MVIFIIFGLRNDDRVYLYKDGDECIENTDGWTTYTSYNALCDKLDSEIYFNGVGSSSKESFSYIRTNKQITPAEIYLSVKNISRTDTGVAFCVFLSQKESISTYEDYNSIANKKYIAINEVVDNEYIEIFKDVSDNETGYLYILSYLAGTTSYQNKCYVNNIYYKEVPIETDISFYLYKEGDQCIDVTGGWEAITQDSGTGNIINVDGGVIIEDTDYNTRLDTSYGLTTRNNIPLNEYSYICAEFEVNNIYKTNNNSYVVPYEDGDIYMNNLSQYAIMSREVKYVLNKTSLANINGQYKVSMSCYNSKALFKNIWLEK